MMLHRHFDGEGPKNMTTLADVMPAAKETFVPEVFPQEEQVETQKKRGRKAKTAE